MAAPGRSLCPSQARRLTEWCQKRSALLPRTILVFWFGFNPLIAPVGKIFRADRCTDAPAKSLCFSPMTHLLSMLCFSPMTHLLSMLCFSPMTHLLSMLCFSPMTHLLSMLCFSPMTHLLSMLCFSPMTHLLSMLCFSPMTHLLSMLCFSPMTHLLSMLCFSPMTHLLSMLCVLIKILSHDSAKKKTERLKVFRFRAFIGCFQVTSWE